MKFNINKSLFENILSLVQPILPTRTTSPILANVLIECKGDEISISATDNETSLTVTAPAEVTNEGEIAINGKNLYSIVRVLPQTILTFSVENLLATIEYNESKFTLPGMSKEEFPELLSIEGEKINVPFELIVRGIDKTSFCALGEETSIMSGVLFNFKEDGLEFVATDGYKLGLVKTSHIPNISVKESVIPLKVCRELGKFTDGIDIIFDKNVIGFVSPKIKIVTKLLEGSFPPYEKVIPKDNDKILLVSRSALIDVLHRMLVFAPEINKLVKFKLTATKVFIDTASEVGEAHETLDCSYQGDEIKVGYNGSYLLSILTKIESDRVKISTKSQNEACVVEPDEQGEEKLLYLLMPIRLE